MYVECWVNGGTGEVATACLGLVTIVSRPGGRGSSSGRGAARRNGRRRRPLRDACSVTAAARSTCGASATGRVQAVQAVSCVPPHVQAAKLEFAAHQREELQRRTEAVPLLVAELDAEGDAAQRARVREQHHGTLQHTVPGHLGTLRHDIRRTAACATRP